MTEVIDLGETHGEVDARSPAIRPRLRLDTRVVTALIAVLLLVGVTAAAPLPPPPVQRLMTVHANGLGPILIAADHLYVADVHNKVSELSAYLVPGGTGGTAPSIPGGEWSVRTEMSPPELNIELRDGILLLQQFQGVPLGAQLEAHDPRTGAVLWRSAGTESSIPTAPGTMLLNGPRTNELQLVDARTGQRRWDLDVPADCQFSIDVPAPTNAPATILVEVCASESRMHVIDLVTGRQTRSGPVDLGDPAAPPPSGWSVRFSVTAVDDVIVIAHSDTPTPAIDAYAASDLRPLWSGRRFVLVQGVYDCFGVLCVGGDGVQLVIDPHGGGTLPAFRDPPSEPEPSTMLVVVVERTTDATPPSSAPITLPARGIGDSIQAPIYRGGWDIWASVRSRDSSGRVDVRPLQLLRGVRPDSCLTVPGLLACATAKNDLTLWRLPGYLG